MLLPQDINYRSESALFCHLTEYPERLDGASSCCRQPGAIHPAGQAAKLDGLVQTVQTAMWEVGSEHRKGQLKGQCRRLSCDCAAQWRPMAAISSSANAIWHSHSIYVRLKPCPHPQ